MPEKSVAFYRKRDSAREADRRNGVGGVGKAVAPELEPGLFLSTLFSSQGSSEFSNSSMESAPSKNVDMSDRRKVSSSSIRCKTSSLQGCR